MLLDLVLDALSRDRQQQSQGNCTIMLEVQTLLVGQRPIEVVKALAQVGKYLAVLVETSPLLLGSYFSEVLVL